MLFRRICSAELLTGQIPGVGVDQGARNDAPVVERFPVASDWSDALIYERDMDRPVGPVSPSKPCVRVGVEVAVLAELALRGFLELIGMNRERRHWGGEVSCSSGIATTSSLLTLSGGTSCLEDFALV